MNVEKFHPEFVTDSDGNKKEIILPIEELDELLDDIDVLACTVKGRDEPTVVHKKVMEDLKINGYLSD